MLFDFTSSGKNINLNSNASSFPNAAFQGIILAPNDAMSMTNANLDGRFFGGDSADMQIVSGSTINAPIDVPEPSPLAIMLGGLVGPWFLLRKRIGLAVAPSQPRRQ